MTWINYLIGSCKQTQEEDDQKQQAKVNHLQNLESQKAFLEGQLATLNSDLKSHSDISNKIDSWM